MVPEVEEIKKCPECGGRLQVDEKRGERFCKECGLIVEGEKVDPGPDWREYSPKDIDNRRRAGPPNFPKQTNKNFSTEVGKVNRDAYGNPVSDKSLVYRLRREQKRLASTWEEKEKRRSRGLENVVKICSRERLPREVKQEAIGIYKKATEQGIARGTATDSVTAASIYAACRKRGIPRTLDEIAEQSSVDREKMSKFYRLLLKELNIRTTFPSPEQYLYRFSEKFLDDPEEVQTLVDRASSILAQAKEEDLVQGRNPVSMAAAAIYLSCSRLKYTHSRDYKLTQRELAGISGVTAVTLRNRYKEMEDKLPIGEIFRS